MINQVLWTLDNEMDGGRFERLCTDLLGREGYQDIVPIGGTYDRGRDAEICRWKGIKATGGVTFFQYSLEKDWRGKLDRELKKVYKNGHKINFYVFVTSQRVTGNNRDKLGKCVVRTYGWQLIVYDREWLRHRLEEAHPDLAVKYLGISEAFIQKFREPQLEPPIPPSNSSDRAWQLYTQGKYEVAAVEFKEILRADENVVSVWQGLAWCQYVLFRYDEALVSINRAIALNEDNEFSWALKASILTEDGIRQGAKANLLLARDIFKKIAEQSTHWVDHYNYGNALHAIGDYEGAKREFLTALKYNPEQVEIWKNLGTVYFHLHDHEEEIRCYDKALTIDNQHFEALVSKGTTLLQVFGKAQAAAELISLAIKIDESNAIRWPYVWYWLSQAYHETDDQKEALKQINKGLEIVPYHTGFLDLKALILSRLWRKEPEFISEALSFFRFRVELSDNDYDSFTELITLYVSTEQNDLAWGLIADYLDLDADRLIYHLGFADHNLDDYLLSLRYFATYKNYRTTSLIHEYMELLESRHIGTANDFEGVMFFVCAIPFGLACDILANLPQTERASAIEKIHSIILNSLKSSLSRLGVKLLEAVKLGTVDQIANGLTPILLVWPDIALIEFSRQVGFIGAIFGIPVEDLDGAVVAQGEYLSTWQRQVMSETLVEINNQLKIFKE